MFEEDPSMLELLVRYLEKKGHEVRGFLDKYSCPLYQLESCSCPAEKPCADAVIVHTRVANQKCLLILLDQDKKGCKLPKINKAIMSANITEDQERHIQGMGFSAIKKPLRLATLNNWLMECSERL